MKRLFIVLIFLLSIDIVHASTLKAGTSKYNFNTTKKIIKEVMKDYYIRGENIQYHNSRRKTPGLSPEDATSQDRQYHVCSAYSYNSLYEAFKIKDIGKYSNPVIAEARNYYNDMIKGKEKDDGHFLIYYENKGVSRYAYKNKTKFSDFINLLQPGDVVSFTGHVMMVYDKGINPLTGKQDILLLNSNGGTEISSRLGSTRRLFYNYDTTRSNNTVVDVDVEGGIQYKWFSAFGSRFVKSYANYPDSSGKNKTIDCMHDKSGNSHCKALQMDIYNLDLECRTKECVIIRPYYKSSDGNTIFNYDIDTSSYLKSYLRTKYPGMVIEKTVDKGDNNSVYLGNTLTYTIKITNKSNATNQGKDSIKYAKFSIKETIDTNLVGSFKSSDCTISGKEITCNVSGLASGKSITIKYSVKVKNNEGNINKEITSTGKFYGSYSDLKNVYIETGTVVNKIIPSVTKEKDYKACYEKWKNKGKSGLDLINHVYSCEWTASVWTSEYNLNNFSFTDMFKRQAKENDQVVLNTESKTYKTFYSMILNNYWSAVTVLHPEGKETELVPLKWSGAGALRKYTVNDTDFKNGDILIYYIDYDKGVPDYDSNTKKFSLPNIITPSGKRHTKEKGYYAYIYIDGKFVGVNYSGKSNERNEFTYQYYKTTYGDNGYTNNLYSKYSSLPSKQRDKILEIANYETLLDKDYFIILRPEILIADKTKPIAKGNVDGKNGVDNRDYVLVRNHILKKKLLTGEELKRADVDGKNGIDNRDYVLIRNIILGK